MTAAELIRDPGLRRQVKFFGLLSFPLSSFQSVCNEIATWILIREQENARQLGVSVPAKLDWDRVVREANGCKALETGIHSLVEMALAPKPNLSREGAAIRYVHSLLNRIREPGRTACVPNPLHGFETSFVFQENLKTKSVFLWIRLNYCRAGAKKLEIGNSVPRIFGTITCNCKGVKILIDDHSPTDIIYRERNSAPEYEEVAERIRSLVPKSAAAVVAAHPPAPTPRPVMPKVETRPQRADRLASRLAELRAAVQGLHRLVAGFFSPASPDSPTVIPRLLVRRNGRGVFVWVSLVLGERSEADGDKRSVIRADLVRNPYLSGIVDDIERTLDGRLDAVAPGETSDVPFAPAWKVRETAAESDARHVAVLRLEGVENPSKNDIIQSA